MQVTHPHAGDGAAPGYVDVQGERVPVTNGTFEIPADASGWLRAFASRHGVDPGDLAREEDDPPDTCDTVMTDGTTCGRELPCPYHTDDTDDETED